MLQTGNHVDVRWMARLEEHLGSVTVEPRRAYGADAMGEAAALAGLMSLAALARLLPERDPHPGLYEITLFVLGFLDDATVWPALLVRWEIALARRARLRARPRAVRGDRRDVTDLVYVSPKSGRAVSTRGGRALQGQDAGATRVPAFRAVKGEVSAADLAAGFALTGRFIEERVLAPRGLAMPEPRGRLLGLLAKVGR